jgi:hypothetical protein
MRVPVACREPELSPTPCGVASMLLVAPHAKKRQREVGQIKPCLDWKS